jgi:hypothetical protein
MIKPLASTLTSLSPYTLSLLGPSPPNLPNVPSLGDLQRRAVEIGAAIPGQASSLSNALRGPLMPSSSRSSSDGDGSLANTNANANAGTRSAAAASPVLIPKAPSGNNPSANVPIVNRQMMPFGPVVHAERHQQHATTISSSTASSSASASKPQHQPQPPRTTAVLLPAYSSPPLSLKSYTSTSDPPSSSSHPSFSFSSSSSGLSAGSGSSGPGWFTQTPPPRYTPTVPGPSKLQSQKQGWFGLGTSTRDGDNTAEGRLPGEEVVVRSGPSSFGSNLSYGECGLSSRSDQKEVKEVKEVKQR